MDVNLRLTVLWYSRTILSRAVLGIRTARLTCLVTLAEFCRVFGCLTDLGGGLRVRCIMVLVLTTRVLTRVGLRGTAILDCRCELGE